MLYKQIELNKQRTVLSVILFCIVMFLVGGAISVITYGHLFTGILITALFLLIYIPTTVLSATKQMMFLTGAKLADPTEYKEVYAIVEELIVVARIPMPKICIAKDTALNAFAIGLTQKNAAIVLTSNLTKRLNREELTAVIAHEMAHIRNYDMLLKTVCIALMSILMIISYLFGREMKLAIGSFQLVWLVFIILSPIYGILVAMLISRNREYLADAMAIDLTRNPEGLKKALQAVSKNTKDVMGATFFPHHSISINQ